MLYHLLVPLRDHIIGANLFRYLTFRSALAAVLGLVISFWIGPWLIRQLKSHQLGEEIRADGPATHFSKAGTPTMGGLMILAAVAIPTLLLANLKNFYVLLTLLAFLWMGAIGFFDDYLKTVKKKKQALLRGRNSLRKSGLV